MVHLPGHVPGAIDRAAGVASPPAAQADPLLLTVILKRADQAGFDRHLREVYDPHSVQFRRFLEPRELSDRFGPTQETYDRLLSYLERHGFVLDRGSANRSP
jgi:subtilase family serine protease